MVIFVHVQANTKKKKMSPEIFMLELTREEFAEELRMKANSTFVVKVRALNNRSTRSDCSLWSSVIWIFAPT